MAGKKEKKSRLANLMASFLSEQLIYIHRREGVKGEIWQSGCYEIATTRAYYT